MRHLKKEHNKTLTKKDLRFAVRHHIITQILGKMFLYPIALVVILLQLMLMIYLLEIIQLNSIMVVIMMNILLISIQKSFYMKRN